MAGKGIKKSQSNFEKMKREMITKKQLADMQQIPESLRTISINDHEAHVVENEIVERLVEKVQQNEQLELVVFQIDEEEFAIRISNVKEIIRVPSMTNMPNSSQHIKGLCSLRGMLLPVIDCKKMFGMADDNYGESSRIIVIDFQGKKVGLLSDKVTEVISIEESDIQSPPSTLRSIDGEIINGIFMLNSGRRAVILLDSDKIIKFSNLEVAKKQQLAASVDYKSSENDEHNHEQIVVFTMDTEEFGLYINDIKEIIRLSDVIKVPHAPNYIEGMLSVRNQLLPILNLSKLLGMNYSKHNEDNRIIIIDNGCSSFGVVVDKVSRVIGVHKKLFKESSQIARSSLIKGIFNLDEGSRQIMMLDPRKLMSIEDKKSIMDIHPRTAVEEKNSFSHAKANDFVHIVIFKIGYQEYAVEINQAQEIRNLNELTKLPGAPSFITGMVNLRESILPILNLRENFIDQDTGSDNASKYLVVNFRDKKIGILVDSASEVLRCLKINLEEASEVIDGSDNYISKIVKLNEGKRIVLILNLKEILSFM